MPSAIAQQFAIERHERLTPHEREAAQERIVQRYLQAKALEDQEAIARRVREASGAAPLPEPMIAIVPPRWPAWVLRRHARHAVAFGDHFETCPETDCVSFRL